MNEKTPEEAARTPPEVAPAPRQSRLRYTRRGRETARLDASGAPTERDRRYARQLAQLDAEAQVERQLPDLTLTLGLSDASPGRRDAVVRLYREALDPARRAHEAERERLEKRRAGRPRRQVVTPEDFGRESAQNRWADSDAPKEPLSGALLDSVRELFARRVHEGIRGQGERGALAGRAVAAFRAEWQRLLDAREMLRSPETLAAFVAWERFGESRGAEPATPELMAALSSAAEAALEEAAIPRAEAERLLREAEPLLPAAWDRLLRQGYPLLGIRVAEASPGDATALAASLREHAGGGVVALPREPGDLQLLEASSPAWDYFSSASRLPDGGAPEGRLWQDGLPSSRVSREVTDRLSEREERIASRARAVAEEHAPPADISDGSDAPAK